jgi:NhaP-type Na+/H+ and K+/H+ antiporter
MTMLQAESLTPRDVNNLLMLKRHGLELVEVRISQVSFARGQLLANIDLPENTRVLCVLRNGKPIVDLDAVFLEEQDCVYVLTDDETVVRETFSL